MRRMFCSLDSRMVWVALPGLLGFLLHLWLAAPGLVSFDAASQFAQTQTGQFDNMHPVAMTLFWQFLNAIFPGPPGSLSMLVAQDLLYYAACLWIAWMLGAARRCYGGLTVLLLCFWPPFFALQAHVWKDCLLASVWLLGIAALLSELLQERYRRCKLMLALLCFGLGALLRHNALLALPPILYWIATRAGIVHRGLRLFLAIIALPIMLQMNQVLARYVDAKPSPAWAVTAIFDLTAEAIATGQWHVPQHLRVEAPLSQFAAAFKSYSGVPLFSASLIVDGVSGPLTEQDKQLLFRNWLTLPLRSPSAYFAHRLRVARLFLLPKSEDLPATLWFVPTASPALGQSEPWQPRISAYSSVFSALSTQFWCGLGFYALAGIACFGISMRRRDVMAAFTRMLLCSAACFFVPLLVLINATEFRYGYYMMLCVMLAILILGAQRTLVAKSAI
jgi:hypothetical protein